MTDPAGTEVTSYKSPCLQVTGLPSPSSPLVSFDLKFGFGLFLPFLNHFFSCPSPFPMSDRLPLQVQILTVHPTPTLILTIPAVLFP